MLSLIPCWGSNSWILECCTSTLPTGCRPQLCTAHFRGGSFMRWGQIYPKNTTTDSVLSPSMALWLQSVGALSLTSVYVVRVSLRSGIIHCGPGSCPGPTADYIQWVIPCPCPENMWFCNSTVAFTQVQKKISHLVLGNFFFFFYIFHFTEGPVGGSRGTVLPKLCVKFLARYLKNWLFPVLNFSALGW